MVVQLNAETERLVREEIDSGHFRSAAELVEQAVAALREKFRSSPSVSPKPRKSLAAILSQPPFAGSELDLERQKDYPRPLDLRSAF